jgi:transcriptional regulator GlxA family with amidase domain
MQRIGLIIPPGFQMMSLAATSAFEVANGESPQGRYALELLSEHGGAVLSSLGLALETRRFGDPAFDTLLVAGQLVPAPASPVLLDFLRAALPVTRRVAAICTGAFILAEAGLLDGRRVTTHWAFARQLQHLYPQVRLEQDSIFIAEGPIWTSAGMTAGIDLALGLIEQDFGSALARSVAQKLVVYHRRAGGQSQHSTLLELDAKSDRIQSALTYAKQNLRSPLSVEHLAEAAHLSPRQFSRAFHAATGQSPAKAIEHLRVEAARLMLEQTRHSIDVVATETGFADRERMRRAFLRAFGQPPQAIRRSARRAAVAA